MIFNPNVMAAAGGGGAVVGTYTGNADTARTIELPFKPALLIVFKSSNATKYIAFIRGNGCFIFGLSSATTALSRSHTSGVVALNSPISNGIIDLSGNIKSLLNSNGESYTYIAFPES